MEVEIQAASKIEQIAKCSSKENSTNEVFLPSDTLDEPRDVLLVVQDDKELRAHRKVLSAASPFFEKLLSTDMKESKEGIVRLEMFSESVMAAALEFIYTDHVQGFIISGFRTNVSLKLVLCKQRDNSFRQRYLMASISRGLHFIPLLWSLLLIVNVITSRLIIDSIHSQNAVRTRGSLLAESIFSELLDLLAWVGLASIIVRYLQLEMVTRGLTEDFLSSVSRLRSASLAFGVGSMLGIALISNFRQPHQQALKHTEIPVTVHYVGGVLVGICGITYCLFQTAVTFYLSKLQINTVRLFVLRIVISSLLCVSGLTHVSMDIWVAMTFLKKKEDTYKPLNSNMRNSETRVIEAINDFSGWVMFVLFALFSSTYFQEFSNLGVQMSCFSKENGRQPESSDKDYTTLKHRESESSDQD